MTSVTYEAKKYLKKIAKPSHSIELTEYIGKKVDLTSKTPQESVRTILSLDNSFASYGLGMYGLKEWGFKWFKIYHKQGFYFSVPDLCYQMLTLDKGLSVDKLFEQIEKKYPMRYSNLKTLIFSGAKTDPRFLISMKKIHLRSISKEIFLPNNIVHLLSEVEAYMEGRSWPVYYKQILKDITVLRSSNLTSKEVLLLALNTDARFVKLGPKAHFGLSIWVS